jgi:hypothetical protein
MTKKEFMQLVEYATNGKHDFLFVNRRSETGKRLRKGFDKIIEFNNNQTNVNQAYENSNLERRKVEF